MISFNDLKEIAQSGYKNNKNNIKNIIRNKNNKTVDLVNKTKSYASSKLNNLGHWVTIDGNHVFIED